MTRLHAARKPLFFASKIILVSMVIVVVLYPLFLLSGTSLALAADAPQLFPEGIYNNGNSNAMVDGLSEEDLGNIKKLVEIKQYLVQADKNNRSYIAYNRRHNFSMEFTSDGIKVTPDKEGEKWLWGLRVKGYGYGEELKEVSDAKLKAKKNRIEYIREGLVEWYVNDGRGIEQGFTINRKLDRRKDGEAVRVKLEILGNLKPVISNNNKIIDWVDSKGGKVLQYSGLYAYDAKGKALESRMGINNEGIWIEVRDDGAEYPIIIDPYIQQAKLTASDAMDGDQLGNSVSIDGDTVVVGATGDDCTPSGADCGSVYVFQKPVNGWADMNEIAKLTASDAAAGDGFGTSVSIDGDTVVVGATGDDCTPSGADCGSVYVFQKPVNGWADMNEIAKLTASDAAAGDFFGSSVSIDGDTVVVGGFGNDCTPSGTECGSAYIFEKPVSGWVDMNEIAKLTASDAAENIFLGSGGHFGFSVSINGDTVVVGAPISNLCAPSEFACGFVYIFEKPVSGWVDMNETAKLAPSDGMQGSMVGSSVSISGDTVAAGGAGNNIDCISACGSAYVFEKPVSGWVDMNETAKLTPSDAMDGDQLGNSISISGDTVVVGASSSNECAPGEFACGSVYIFEKPVSGWVDMNETAKLTASDAAGGDNFGFSVSNNGDTVVVGAIVDDCTPSGTDCGSVYVIGSTITPQDIDVLIVDDLNSSEPFTNHPIVTIPPVDGAIGAISELTGPGGFITRANGSMEPLTVGAPIFEGDVIETDENQELNIVFIDESTFAVSENALLEIDEYVYDPNESTGDSNFSLLRGLFIFTSGLIGKDDPEDIEDACTGNQRMCCSIDANNPCIGSIGVRGDAEEWLRLEYFNDPESTQYGVIGGLIQSASPMQLSTFVEIPDDPFNLKFDYIFLNEEGDLVVSLCGVQVFQASASPGTVGLPQNADIPIDMPAMTCEMIFQINHENPGKSVIITNLAAPGTGLSDFDVWFRKGEGNAEFVFLTTIEQIIQLITDAENGTDSDGDGTPNSQDECRDDPNKIAPGTCGCGIADTDSDNDGTPDCNDDCVSDPGKIAAGVCGCGVSDADSDNDGTLDCNDQCTSDPAKINPGTCGCGIADTDSDKDSIPDCNDSCNAESGNDADGDSICGNGDNCPADPNPDQSDSDNDGIGDACDEVDNSNPVTIEINGTTIAINNNGNVLNDLEVRINIGNNLGILGVSLDPNSGECSIEQDDGVVVCQIDEIDDVVNVILQLCKEGDIEGVAQVVVNVLSPSIQLDVEEVVDIIVNDLQVCNVEGGADGSNGGCSLAPDGGRTANQVGHFLPFILLPLILIFRRRSRQIKA